MFSPDLDVTLACAIAASMAIPGVFDPVTIPGERFVDVEKKHSPSRFSTGSKGGFTIKVRNQGGKLEKGMLTIVDHMPPGLSVKMGTFRAGSWNCKGGMVSSSGQDVTCTYNRKLNKNGRATLRLNAKVASKDQFPAGVNEVENCATASVQGAAGVKVCDKVKIKHKKSRGLFDLPINIGIGIGGFGGGGGGTAAPARKTPGAVR